VGLKTAVAISKENANALCKAEGGFGDDVEVSIAVQIGDDNSISGLSNVVIRLDPKGPISVTQQDADIAGAVICYREIWFPITIEISESAVIGVATHRVAHRRSKRLRKHGGSFDKSYQTRDEKDGEKLCASDGRRSFQLRTSGFLLTESIRMALKLFDH
jgi:hypothetical protein